MLRPYIVLQSRTNYPWFRVGNPVYGVCRISNKGQLCRVIGSVGVGRVGLCTCYHDLVTKVLLLGFFYRAISLVRLGVLRKIHLAYVV